MEKEKTILFSTPKRSISKHELGRHGHIMELERSSYPCFHCQHEFQSIYLLQAHLMSHTHPNLWTKEFKKNPTYTCLKCFTELNHKTCETHKCTIELKDKLSANAKQINSTCGPFSCLSCRGRLFASRNLLIIHIIITHSHHRHAYKCSICGITLRTADTHVQELHAINQHLPELVIACKKALVNSGKSQLDPSKPFFCTFPNQILDNGKIKRKNCLHQFNSIVDFTAHLICSHSSYFQHKPHYREECRSCQIGFNDEFSFKQHVQERHLCEYSKRLRGLVDRKKMVNQINPDKTCFECYRIYPNTQSMQVHCLVSHATESWRICGLCGIEFTDENDKVPHSILFLMITMHEKQHLAFLRSKPNTASDMSLLGLPPPQLYKDKYIPGLFGRQSEENKDQDDDVLTKELREWFTSIGEKNIQAQDKLDDDLN